MTQPENQMPTNDETPDVKQDHQGTMTAKEEAGEFFKSAMIAILVALFIRSFLWEPFNIPCGSM